MTVRDRCRAECPHYSNCHGECGDEPNHHGDHVCDSNRKCGECDDVWTQCMNKW